MFHSKGTVFESSPMIWFALMATQEITGQVCLILWMGNIITNLGFTLLYENRFCLGSITSACFLECWPNFSELGW